jgi:class 3 adenylate cyclase/tetratricopeptide (TPR) repeat protein
MERCPACDTVSPSGARFCSHCGSALADGAHSPPTHDAEAVERKQVTVLFSDLTGYTALSERLDPEETREIMGRVFGRAAEIVARYDGRIEKFVGDAIMAIFGVPTAHEDDPVRAVRAALELHHAVEAMNPELEVRIGAALALHTGINTGLVVTGELQFDHGTAGPLGDTINLAARLMGEAPRDEIWVGPQTRRLVARAFELEDLGEHALKGKAEPVPIARVRGGAKLRAAVRSAAFVGRQEELGVLLGAAERLRDGQPGVIAICGEAGTGKTRLIEEFRARLGPDVQWLEGRAYPYAENIPYFPLIDLLNRSWGIQEDDSPAEVRRKVESNVAALLGAPGDALPIVARLYDLELRDAPEIDREAFQGRLLDAMRQLLTALARRAPTVICLQDLHWADASTVALLRGLTGDLQIPALLVGNYRPGYTPGPAARILELRELSPRQTRELLESLLGGDAPPQELVGFIEERSDGNPFYVEEVVNSLVETHVLARVDGHWRLAKPLTELGIPTTIRGVIAARIDRLDEPRRRVLRDAAVVGREFLYEVIARVTRESDELAPSLDQLEAADLIRTRSRDPDVEYIFKHALTQEVAYDGLLRGERQALHERAAFAMEQILRERIPEFVETLAYHFLRAGVVDKAVHYLRESGRKCVARYAIADAATHYRNAYALLTGRARTSAEDRALVGLLIDWSLVHYYQGDCGDWRVGLEENLAVAEGLGDAELLGLYLGWTGHMLYWHEELDASLEHLDRAVQIGHEAGSKLVVAYGESWRAHTLLFLARSPEALEAGERALALGREFPDTPYLVCKPLMAIAYAAGWMGDLERARLAGEELFEIARRTGNSRALVMGQSCLCLTYVMSLDNERYFEAARTALKSALDQGYRNLAACWVGWSSAYTGRWDEVTRILEEFAPLTERLSQKILTTNFRGLEGMVAMSRGELPRAFALIEAEVARVESGPAMQFAATYSLAFAYAGIARAETTGGFRALVQNLLFMFRNPGFVIRRVIPARRKALALLNRFADDPPNGLRGYSGLAMLELARLHADKGERDAAAARVAGAIEFFERQGGGEALRQAGELAASLAS